MSKTSIQLYAQMLYQINKVLRHHNIVDGVLRGDLVAAALSASVVTEEPTEREIAIAEKAAGECYNKAHSGGRKAYCDLNLDFVAIVKSVSQDNAQNRRNN